VILKPFRRHCPFYSSRIVGGSSSRSVYGSWNNRPPNNLSSSDDGSSSGLRWTLGNK